MGTFDMEFTNYGIQNSHRPWQIYIIVPIANIHNCAFIVIVLFYSHLFCTMCVNCTIFYVLYILSTVYICDFMHLSYFVRNDEIKMFNQLSKNQFAYDQYMAQYS